MFWGLWQVVSAKHLVGKGPQSRKPLILRLIPKTKDTFYTFTINKVFSFFLLTHFFTLLERYRMMSQTKVVDKENNQSKNETTTKPKTPPSSNHHERQHVLANHIRPILA
jgi:hypothetical protein